MVRLSFLWAMGRTEASWMEHRGWNTPHAMHFLSLLFCFQSSRKPLCVHGNDKGIYFIFSNIKRGNLEEHSIYKNLLTASWDPYWHTCMRAPSMSNASTDCAGALGGRGKYRDSQNTYLSSHKWSKSTLALLWPPGSRAWTALIYHKIGACI